MPSRRLRCQGCVVTAQPNACSGFGVGDAAVGQSNAIANGFDLLSAIAFPHVFQLDCWPCRDCFCLCIFVSQESEFHGLNRNGLRLFVFYVVVKKLQASARYFVLSRLSRLRQLGTGSALKCCPGLVEGMMRVVGFCVGCCVVVERFVGFTRAVELI